MNKLLLLIDPAPDAVQTAADLILMLLLPTRDSAALPRCLTLTISTAATGQIRIIAEYPENKPSAPLLHPLNGAQKPKTTVCTSRIKRRRCTASARPGRIN